MKKFPLRLKLFTAFSLILLASLGSVSAVSNFMLTASIKAEVGRNLKSIAQSQGFASGGLLARQVDALRSLSLDRVLRERALNFSEGYSGSPDEIIEKLRGSDQVWREAAINDLMVQSTLNNLAASEMLAFQHLFPLFLSMILTDQYGGLIAATHYSSSYYHGDESWWVGAYDHGQGKSYIGQPYHLPGNTAWVVDIAVPVFSRDNSHVVGILKGTYSLNLLIQTLNASKSKKDDLELDILFPNGNTMVSAFFQEQLSDELVSSIFALSRQKGDYIDANLSQVGGHLISPADVISITGEPAVQNLGWVVVVLQGEQAALAPIWEQQSLFGGLALVLLLVIGVASGLFASILTNPIRQLVTTMEQVRYGNLDARVRLTTNDEIGELSETFNEMTFHLQENLKALQYEHRRTQHYLDTVNTIIVVLNQQGLITTINRKGCQVLERTEDELLGKSWFAECQPFPELSETAQAYFLQLMNGADVTPMEYDESPVITASGAIRYIAWHNVVLYDENKRPIGSLSAGDDITERRQEQEALRQLTEELEDRVARRTAELEKSNKELESFSYSISHDLRAPLRAIDGLSRIIQEDFVHDLPPDALRLFQRVRDNAQRMGQLIDDLLHFSRLGRQTLQKKPISMNELVKDAILNLQHEYEQRNVAWKMTPLPASYADPALVTQVWVNLISNALKYSRLRDTIVIEISSQLGEKGETIYFVRDNGVGFDMQYVNKLFGVFQRLHSEAQFEGTGVGLALVHRIIERHGGRIWAESALDKGASFFFTLGVPIEKS